MKMMRAIVVGVCMGAMGVVATNGVAEELPVRKAGAWTVTVNADGKSAISEQCIDAATDKKMQQIGQGMMGGNCSKNEVKKTGGGYLIDSECTFGGSKMISKAEFKGDFGSSYEGTITAKFDPPFLGQSGSTTTMKAKFMGPCPAGKKPGDITTEGFTMNINQMGQGFPGMGE